MKKSLIFIVIFLFPFLLQGQGVGLGIKAGANWANQDVSNVDIKSVTDYLFGAYVNVNFSDKWGITPEVLYSAYGTEWDNAKVDLDYIAIPVMLRFKPIGLLSLEAGPQFSFLTKANVENVGDVKDQHVGARYILGFTNISDVSSETVKNRTFQLSVGWTIFGAK
jgi:hypothetical protein